MTPERIEELREIADDDNLTWMVSSEMLAECLNEIDRLRNIIEEANGVGFPYEEMARKVRGE